MTKTHWVTTNTVSPDSVKMLLQRFNISSDTINQMIPVINSHVEDGRYTASYQASFVDYYDKSNEKIPFFEQNRFDWTGNRF